MRFAGTKVAGDPDPDFRGLVADRIGVVLKEIIEVLFNRRCYDVTAKFRRKLAIVCPLADRDDGCDLFIDTNFKNVLDSHACFLSASVTHRMSPRYMNSSSLPMKL